MRSLERVTENRDGPTPVGACNDLQPLTHENGPAPSDGRSRAALLGYRPRPFPVVGSEGRNASSAASRKSDREGKPYAVVMASTTSSS